MLFILPRFMSSRNALSQSQNSMQLTFVHELELSGTQSDQIRESLTLPPLPEYLPVFGVRLVRSDYVRLDERAKIRSPRDAVNVTGEILKSSDREQMVAILLDTKNGVNGLHVVSVGDLSSAVVHPREVFKAAILANAASLILAHNHPSGDPTPSPEDIAVTRRIAEAGELLGIELLDHVVVGHGGRFVSLKEKGIF